MGQTPTFALPYPEPADPADVPTDMHELCTRLEQVLGAMPVVPIGAIVDWPYASGGIPTWALLCYGQAISRTSYAALAALAAAAAYPHGAGDGTSTFALPDLRGRVLAGKDDMGGATAGRITAAISGVNGVTLGVVGGSEGVVLTTAQLAAHNHGGVTGNDSPGHTHSGSTGNDTPDHVHGGTTGTESADHSHYTTTGGRSAGHTHLVYAMRAGGGYGLSTANAGFKENVAVAWATGGVDVSFQTPGESGDHTHAGQSGGRNVAHTHDFSSYGANTRHTHPFSSGDASVRHTHGVTLEGGGAAHANAQPLMIVNKMMRAL